jgi:hypothetical protein
MDIPSQAIGFGKLGRNATEIGFAAHLKLKSFSLVKDRRKGSIHKRG